MAAENDEAVGLPSDTLILVRRDADDSGAPLVGALAHNLELAVPIVAELGDPLVDLAKEKLVLDEALLAAFHSGRTISSCRQSSRFRPCSAKQRIAS